MRWVPGGGGATKVHGKRGEEEKGWDRTKLFSALEKAHMRLEEQAIKDGNYDKPVTEEQIWEHALANDPYFEKKVGKSYDRLITKPKKDKLQAEKNAKQKALFQADEDLFFFELELQDRIGGMDEDARKNIWNQYNKDPEGMKKLWDEGWEIGDQFGGEVPKQAAQLASAIKSIFYCSRRSAVA